MFPIQFQNALLDIILNVHVVPVGITRINPIKARKRSLVLNVDAALVRLMRALRFVLVSIDTDCVDEHVCQ